MSDEGDMATLGEEEGKNKTSIAKKAISKVKKNKKKAAAAV